MDYYFDDDYFIHDIGIKSKQFILKYLKDGSKKINSYDMIPERYRIPKYVVTKFNTKTLRDVVK